MSNTDHHVAVLGASPKPARYANQCIRLLQQHGYRITPVHPRFDEIESLPVTHSLDAIDSEVHTLTLYVGPKLLEPQADEIVQLKPGRVIFNPGTESSLIQSKLDDAGIEWFEACTLVMIKTGQF
ncbi:CoA-binding protein [Thiosocius teredinicola]|uniref:CoA-binding protein n=1 Tax=Thiosocius teredinicola TaxID=1973002 RepID=UPI000990A6F8